MSRIFFVFNKWVTAELQIILNQAWGHWTRIINLTPAYLWDTVSITALAWLHVTRKQGWQSNVFSCCFVSVSTCGVHYVMYLNFALTFDLNTVKRELGTDTLVPARIHPPLPCWVVRHIPKEELFRAIPHALAPLGAAATAPPPPAPHTHPNP